MRPALRWCESDKKVVPRQFSGTAGGSQSECSAEFSLSKSYDDLVPDYDRGKGASGGESLDFFNHLMALLFGQQIHIGEFVFHTTLPQKPLA